MHAEATSEKMAMGHFCDGRASLVVGTHTHVPTADAQILTGGTAYQTDAGACADYDSVIGNQKEEPLRRFTTRISGGRFQPRRGRGDGLRRVRGDRRRHRPGPPGRTDPGRRAAVAERTDRGCGGDGLVGRALLPHDQPVDLLQRQVHLGKAPKNR